jgi:ATP-binding cassette subfamily C (CFTR/MRP) protein 1
VSPAHHLAYADNIIALDANGRVIEQGSYQHLMNTNGYVSTISESSQLPNTTRAPDFVLDDETIQGLNIEEEQTEDMSRRTGDLTVYSFYFQNIGWPLLTLFLICCVLFISSLSFPREF